MAMPTDGAPAPEVQAANLAAFGLADGLLPHQEPTELGAEAYQAANTAPNPQIAELEKKFLAMQQALDSQELRHQEELKRMQAASTPEPPSAAGASSSAAPAGPPPAAKQPDTDWQADFADISVDTYNSVISSFVWAQCLRSFFLDRPPLRVGTVPPVLLPGPTSSS